MSEKETTDTLTYKLTVSLLSLGAGWLAQKALVALWRTTVGKGAPRSIEDEDATVAGVVGFAAMSAGVAALTRILASRGTKRLAARLTSPR